MGFTKCSLDKNLFNSMKEPIIWMHLVPNRNVRVETLNSSHYVASPRFIFFMLQLLLMQLRGKKV